MAPPWGPPHLGGQQPPVLGEVEDGLHHAVAIQQAGICCEVQGEVPYLKIPPSWAQYCAQKGTPSWVIQTKEFFSVKSGEKVSLLTERKTRLLLQA